MRCTHVSQFLRLGCVLYVTTLEAYWCTEASAALLLSFCLCNIKSFSFVDEPVTKWAPRPNIRTGGGPVRVPWWPRAGSRSSSAQPEQQIFPPAQVHFILTVLHTATIHTLCPRRRVHKPQATDSLLARVSGLFQRS